MNTIPNESTCPKCGKPVSLHAFEGLCPECLMQAGFGTVTGDPGKISAFVPPTPEELTGHFPQLEILELLGRGGMGAVYKARQTHLDRIVALKILPPGVGQAPSFAERFVREAKALAKLHHPNIVTLYESGQANELFYFLMEFVDGVNLRQLLATGTISPQDALAIVPQICDALQFAHDRGIVHRDIKPENILLSKTGQVKIADFGVAKLVAGELVESSSLGSTFSREGAQTEAGKNHRHAAIHGAGTTFASAGSRQSRRHLRARRRLLPDAHRRAARRQIRAALEQGPDRRTTG